MKALPHLSSSHRRHTAIKRCGREGYNYVDADVEEEKEEEEDEEEEEEEEEEKMKD